MFTLTFCSIWHHDSDSEVKGHIKQPAAHAAFRTCGTDGGDAQMWSGVSWDKRKNRLLSGSAFALSFASQAHTACSDWFLIDLTEICFVFLNQTITIKKCSWRKHSIYPSFTLRSISTWFHILCPRLRLYYIILSVIFLFILPDII